MGQGLQTRPCWLTAMDGGWAVRMLAHTRHLCPQTHYPPSLDAGAITPTLLLRKLKHRAWEAFAKATPFKAKLGTFKRQPARLRSG